MQRLTKPDSPVLIAANDESVIVAGYAIVQVFCVHCGNLKNGLALYVPDAQWGEYQIKLKLINEQPRCLCKREVK